MLKASNLARFQHLPFPLLATLSHLTASVVCLASSNPKSHKLTSLKL